MAKVKILIIVDDVKQKDDFAMTRVIYYFVNVEESFEASLLYPFILFTSGDFLPRIFNLIYGMSEIHTADQIEQIFEEIEKYEDVFIDTGSLWIPNMLFNINPERGYVYRLEYALFNKLLNLSINNATIEHYSDLVKEHVERVEFSEIETKAFNQWTAKVISNLKDNFPKNPKLQLKWKEE